jgi:hypothetical protein
MNSTFIFLVVIFYIISVILAKDDSHKAENENVNLRVNEEVSVEEKAEAVTGIDRLEDADSTGQGKDNEVVISSAVEGEFSNSPVSDSTNRFVGNEEAVISVNQLVGFDSTDSRNQFLDQPQEVEEIVINENDHFHSHQFAESHSNEHASQQSHHRLSHRDIVAHYHQVNSYFDSIHEVLGDIEIQQRNTIISIYNQTMEDANEEDHQNEIMVDLGGGDCLNAERIGSSLLKKVLCIEPHIRPNASSLLYAEYIRLDAASFTSLSSIRYNFIILKEVIHHISPEHYQEIFQNIYHQLLPNGILVVLTRPPRPPFLTSTFFKDRWASTSIDVDSFKQGLTAIGYHVRQEIHDYSTTIPKNIWKDFIKARTWSTFETFTNEEIHNESLEIDKRYPGDNFNYTDSNVFIIAQKSQG